MSFLEHDDEFLDLIASNLELRHHFAGIDLKHITQFSHGLFCCFLIGCGKAHQQAPLNLAVTVLDRERRDIYAVVAGCRCHRLVVVVFMK